MKYIDEKGIRAMASKLPEYVTLEVSDGGGYKIKINNPHYEDNGKYLVTFSLDQSIPITTGTSANSFGNTGNGSVILSKGLTRASIMFKNGTSALINNTNGYVACSENRGNITTTANVYKVYNSNYSVLNRNINTNQKLVNTLILKA